ncbi:MAG: SGNH/GDSL hydrolase family protein [Paenisporosarcina sp.]
MNKTKLIIIFVIIGCITTLFASYNIYQSRIQSITNPTQHASDKETPKDKENSKESTTSDQENDQLKSDSLTAEEITSLTANMSEEAKALVTSRLELGEKIQLLMIGSSSIEQGSPGYGELLTTDLSEAYGEWIETTTVTFEGNTSELVAALDGDLIDWSNEFDVVLLEGMNIENNGQVVVEDSIEHIETINDRMKQNVTDAVLLVHPSQPLASAKYYPKEVESFKSYLTSRDYTFINHWMEWPVGNEVEMNTYLTGESEPNDKGAALWASALSTFFTGK